MLKAKTVAYNDLLLDPANPRLASEFTEGQHLSADDIPKVQAELEARFGVTPERDPQQDRDLLLEDESEGATPDFFSISTLKESMRRIGFVGIQNIIVREIEGTGKYVVIEGNRRVASIRAVLREHEVALPGTPNRIEASEILESLKTIQVMVFETNGLAEEEIDRLINATLGLRHYGSQLNWDLLPRAKNIYDEYMKLSPPPFWYSTGCANQVAEVLALKPPEVKHLLRGFVCYRQLSSLYQVKPHHFSLILAGVENTNLTTHGFFSIEPNCFELLGDTPAQFDRVCEFEDRDKADFQKMIKDPKEFKKLGSLCKDAALVREPEISAYAKGLLPEVLERQISLDDAYTELVGFKKRHKWVQAIQLLIEKQQEDEGLSPSSFLGEGQELALKDDLVRLLKRFSAVMEP